MRPVHDSNGCYRFCIGLQYEIHQDGSVPLQQIAKLDQLIALMPRTLDVCSAAVSVCHRVTAIRSEQTTQLELKLQKALA